MGEFESHVVVNWKRLLIINESIEFLVVTTEASVVVWDGRVCEMRLLTMAR